jgi:hypothetical protein
MAGMSKAITAALATCAISAPASAAEALTDTQLAYRFRPILLFDSQERWRPLDVEAFLAEPGHLACPPTPLACTPLTGGAEQLTPAVDHLDLRGNGPDDSLGPTRIYAHVTRRGARVAIDYWWFLRYNAYSIDRHEGDWEGMTVIADGAGSRVRQVHFAAHADVWRYPAGVPQLVGRRMRVYVSRGAHASYPRPCDRRCRQTEGTLPEARFDGRRPWSGNTAAGCRARCVKLLPPDSWNAWPGRWGITTASAFAAPLTPAFQHRCRHPFTARRTPRTIF